MSETVQPIVLRQSFASIVENKPTVPNNELTPTVVKNVRIEAQAQNSRDKNIIVTCLNTEDDCITICDIAKEIGVSLMDTSFKVRRFGKDNKNVEVRFTDRKLLFEML